MLHASKELIDGKTSLVGVIGCPVQHSLSPAIHNAALKALNLNWCYLAIPCNKHNFDLVIQALRAIDCKGVNITIPHKNKAIDLCKVITPIAKEIGSINTLIPNNENSWIGTNTDVEGFLAPLKEEEYWEHKKAIIIGSGGSAKSVVYGLQSLNISQITIIGRNIDTLNQLLKNINLEGKYSTEIHGLLITDSSISKYIKNADLIVNATPIGMHNIRDQKKSLEIPLGRQIWNNLEPNTILYDLIYTPKPTEWLKLGELYSCKQIDGLEMLVQQGAASLRLWSGIKEIPIKVMRNAAEVSLKI